jgi:CRISPR system Cascade subunit CasB
VTSTDTRARPAEEFVGRLEELSRRDSARADLAILRRCVGRSLSQSPEAYHVFYRLLPYQVRGQERDEERYFLAATLFALDPRLSNARDFGVSMKTVAGARGAGSTGVDRRMAVLLDSSGEELAFRLRQTVGLAAAADVGINWRSLLADLLWWDHPARRVQRRWARSYFGGISASSADYQDSSESED